MLSQMSVTRRIAASRRFLVLACSAAALAAGLAAVAAPAAAQGAFGGYDDDRLYQDQNGAIYRKRAGQYVPYSGRVEGGRPVGPDTAAAPPPPAQPRRAALPEETDADQAAISARTGTRVVSDATKAALARPLDDGPIDYAKAYAAIPDDAFPVPAFNWKKANPNVLRQEVAYNGRYEPGTIVVDPKAHQLFLVQGNGRARRYGVGVGKQGFAWSGSATINSKQAWPDWYPPKEMIARRPDLARQVDKLQSGVGVAGGSRNPLGARAMYLWQDNKDTLFRIHGTTEPESIGHSVSSGCIRMINQDAIDLFGRVNVGTKVVVLN